MAAVGQDNFNNLLPAAPTGGANVKWQADPNTVSPRNISAYFPNVGGVDARTTTVELITAASQGKLITFNNASPVAVALDASGAIAAAAVNAANPGTGYAVNDTFNISGGTGGTGHVVAQSGGIPSSIAINNPGHGYSVSAGNATTATSGVGTGLQVDISVVGGSIATGFLCFLQNLGVGTVTVTPGTGTINGASTLILTSTQAAIVFFDGTNWEAVVVSNFTPPIPVASGGTGDTSLTAHNVLVGEGTSPIAFVATGTAGQVVTSNGASADPTMQWALGGIDTQTGTSYTLLAADRGKLVNFTNAAAVAVTLDSTLSNQFLCGVLFTGAAGGTLTPSSGTINGVASLTLAQNTSALLFFNGTNWLALVISVISTPISVSSGGTGDITLAAHGVLIGEGTSPIAVTGTGTTGQVLTSNGASADPTFQSSPYDVIFTFASTPGGTTTYPWITFTRAVTFPGNFSGASGKVLTNPTSTYAITVKKNGSSVGTISISTGGVFTFTTSGGSPVTVAANDYFTLTTPASDPTLADLMITLAGTR